MRTRNRMEDVRITERLQDGTVHDTPNPVAVRLTPEPRDIVSGS
jgi:hypothetical protein